MTISKNILRIYFEQKRQLIPISPVDPHRLKRPLHTSWTTREYPPDEIRTYVDQGYNLGWRMGPGDVVIDVDPRNDGLTGMADLLKEFQKNDPTIDELSDVFPCVKTGGQGYHFYGRIDPDIKIKDTTLEFGKGVEFKTMGRQVIIPGSTHPSGFKYAFDDFSDYTGPSKPLPQWLVSIIRRDNSRVTLPNVLPTNEAELTPSQLADMLKNLPATDYSTNDEWFPLMAACHEATNGEGLEAFVSWSLSDSSFVGHDYIIRHRWESFEPGKSGNISVGTLYKEVVKHGGELPPMTLVNAGVDALGELPPAPTWEPPMQSATIIHHVDRQQLDKAVENLGVISNASDIKAVLKDISQLDVLDQESYIQILKKKTGRPIRALKKALTQAKLAHMTENSVDIDDVALEVTTYLLQNKFANGAYLVHGKDQRFWRYVNTHWVPVEMNIIENLLLKASYQYRQQNPHMQTPIATLLAQGERVLRARRAVEQNLNESLDGRPPVVNTLNCEVWIDPDNGDLTTREHTPDSWLTSCLDTNFDPRAKCPLFTRSLREMFNNCADREDIIRHLWEVIGYTIQPQKDLAAWVLLHGEGANGKTVVLNVITKLLGKAALNKSIDELDTKRNNHALADLPNKLAVIDEDLDAKTLLPDSILKKISETKTLQANPKMRPSFDFLNTAIILFASNEFPRIKDLSNGMRRRAHVFNFNRTFKDHEQDLGLAKRITETEMGGVLNEALKGFKRLRQRGNWQIPYSCDAAQKQWLIKSNTISEFMDSVMVPSPGSVTEFKHVFSIYKMWCIDNGYTHPSTKPNFSKALKALGVVIKNGSGNKIYVFDYTIQSTDFDLGI